ncbi:unnamed protein product [Parnassius apollo]|uniref:(apollo) hypothetical protein n=1 Tax=Parnassius apollo TaxID=110799 RepID=A0A8S3X6A7_PARAO|nr:unnamed protein product [Parnassius apollo]
MLRFFMVAFFVGASAEVLYDGPCPEVRPMENFSFKTYQGLWYEIARFPNVGEEGARGKCTTASYTVDGDKGKVRNTQVIDGVKSYIDGDLSLVEPGKLMLTYTFGGKSKNSYLIVLDTDYKNYAIAYSCKNLEDTNKHQVFSWIKSRSQTLEGAAKETVDAYLRNSKFIESAKYIKNDHSEDACKATVTRAITEFYRNY